MLNYIRFSNDFFFIFPQGYTFPTPQQLATMMQQSAGMEATSVGEILIDGDSVICKRESGDLNVDSLGKKDGEFFADKIFPHEELPPSLR